MALIRTIFDGERENSALSKLNSLVFQQAANDFETAYLQKQEAFYALASSCGPNGARITPEPLVGFPAVVVAAALAFFAVSFEGRSRGVAWRDATGSHPISGVILAMSSRCFKSPSLWHFKAVPFIWLIPDSVLGERRLLVLYCQRIAMQPNNGGLVSQRLFPIEFLLQIMSYPKIRFKIRDNSKMPLASFIVYPLRQDERPCTYLSQIDGKTLVLTRRDDTQV